jgi:hypothetical protein
MPAAWAIVSSSARHDEMSLDVQFAKHLKCAYTVDDTGRAGDAHDDTLPLAFPFHELVHGYAPFNRLGAGNAARQPCHRAAWPIRALTSWPGQSQLVEHAVPLLLLGIVPVTPLGTGLTPGDASSVAPNGIPVGELAEPVAMPSGEVSPIVGVGVAVPTCAMATLQTKSDGRTAAIKENLIGVLRLQTASSRS